MDQQVARAVEKVSKVREHQGNPFKALYHSPRAMSLTYFAKFAQRYLSHRLYRTILDAAAATGFEPVPACLVPAKSRRKWQGRRVRAGQIVFFLLRWEEMSPTVRQRFREFKAAVEGSSSVKTKSSFTGEGMGQG